MERMFSPFTIGQTELVNRFVFPPIKLGYGNPDGAVTDRQLLFYSQIAKNGPALIILEPVAVTPDGREHPKQLCVHLPASAAELQKIVDVIHGQGRLACLHLNHAGAAANPKAAGGQPKAPSTITCPTTGQESTALTLAEIEKILRGYRAAAEKAVTAGFDMIEVQGGHGYLVSQFLNSKINKRKDDFGKDRLLFAKEVLFKVKEGAPDIPLILRISGNEMSPEFGISQEDLASLLNLGEQEGIAAIHVGMGNSCFSPPWYFHHGSLPHKPQMDSLSWVRGETSLPLIAAGRMGRKEKVMEAMDQGVADLVALGRPLIADPGLIEKWQNSREEEIIPCGYCLQGCLHRLKNGDPLGCNLNPEVGLPPLEPAANPLRILVAGGGPAGMSAAFYLSKRGHQVTLAEAGEHLGGQFTLAWQAPGKSDMEAGLKALEHQVMRSGVSIMLHRKVDASLVQAQAPELLVWATGAVQNIPDIPGLQDQHVLTSLEYFKGVKKVQGPRVLVIGAGRVGLEIAEKLGKEGYEVVATKRTDPIGSMMEMITRKLLLMRLEKLSNVTLMPHTTVKKFAEGAVEVEQDGSQKSFKPFQTVILSSGMNPEEGPDQEIRNVVSRIEIIGDANQVQDIFSAIHSGYELARQV
ncbi:MAG: FAD-dependent oxidoreductase [Deltaproteobacteria bacterium]|nr:FAD-dependent oxidoreductase [Deltaproteobacteria bacterium]